jgi:hypothetical protein
MILLLKNNNIFYEIVLQNSKQLTSKKCSWKFTRFALQIKKSFIASNSIFLANGSAKGWIMAMGPLIRRANI